jgi:hypothetical protein
MRIVRIGPALVVFGAIEYPAPVRLRLFHVEGCRFLGYAYRVTPNPDGGETWSPRGLTPADLRDMTEHIPSLHIVLAGCPTSLEVDEADLMRLMGEAREPRPVRASKLRMSRRDQT